MRERRNKPIKAIIFDLCGVLTFDVWESMLLDEEKGLIRRYGLAGPHAMQTGRDIWEKYACLPEGVPGEWVQMELAFWADVVKSFKLTASAQELVIASQCFIRPLAGMADIVARLHKEGFKLALCSNNSEFFVHRQQAALPVFSFFPAIRQIYSCRVGAVKSSRDYAMYAAAMAALDCRKDECIFIDDRAKNIEAALEFGLPAVLFPAASQQGAAYLQRIFDHILI